MNHRGETHELAARASDDRARQQRARAPGVHGDRRRGGRRARDGSAGAAAMHWPIADDARADVLQAARATRARRSCRSAWTRTPTSPRTLSWMQPVPSSPCVLRGDFAARPRCLASRWRNALAATAAALAAGATLAAAAAALAAFQPVAGRLARTSTPAGAAVIDDTYNANLIWSAPTSTYSRATAPRWLVLGDMGEVGTEGAAFHREIGAYARGRYRRRRRRGGRRCATRYCLAKRRRRHSTTARRWPRRCGR